MIQYDGALLALPLDAKQQMLGKHIAFCNKIWNPSVKRAEPFLLKGDVKPDKSKMWWIFFFTCYAVKGPVNQCSDVRSWGHVLAAHMTDKVFVYHSQPLSNQLLVICLPLSHRSNMQKILILSHWHLKLCNMIWVLVCEGETPCESLSLMTSSLFRSAQL